MMKKYLFVFSGLALLLWQLFSPSTVQAHFRAADKAMTVELHVDPDDDPTPRQPATLYFLFDDATKKFSISQCHCIVTVSEQGKQIFSQALLPNTESKPSIWGAAMSFNFPKRDVYKITLKGQPNEPNAFQPFTLSWYFRVDQYPEGSQSYQQQSDPTFIYFATIFLSIPILLGISIFLIIRHSK